MADETTLLTCTIMDTGEHYKGEIESISYYLIPHNEISQDDHNLLKEITNIVSYEEKSDSQIKFLLATENWEYILKRDITECKRKIKYSAWRKRWEKYLLDEGSKFSNGRIARIMEVYIYTSFELDAINEELIKSLFSENAQ